MSEAEDYGPRGDATRHLPLDRLKAAWNELPEAPSDRGRVALIVSRRADGVRDTPQSAHLTPAGGVPGDRWARLLSDHPEMQMAVMRRDVAEMVANGQPITVAGDNLFVDLDLSAANLPLGSRLRVGTAVVEVSPMPHNGCKKFMARFGSDALRFVSDESLRDQHLRGVYWRVVEAGDVTVGDAIEVLSREPSVEA